MFAKGCMWDGRGGIGGKEEGCSQHLRHRRGHIHAHTLHINACKGSVFCVEGCIQGDRDLWGATS